MVAGKRIIKSGKEFEHLVELPSGINESIKRNSRLEDTIRFLPKGIARTYKQAMGIAPLLMRSTPYATCRAVWDWAYHHFQYEKDVKGKEQIRSFRRSFWERKRGIDCDDFSVVISSLLLCIRDLGQSIPHVFRIAKYKTEEGFQHIYPVAFPEGREVPMDAVIDHFDKEVRFIEKIDKNMDLEFLDGVDPSTEPAPIEGLDNTDDSIYGVDASDLMGAWEEDMGELSGRKWTPPRVIQKAAQKVSNATQKVRTAPVIKKVAPALKKVVTTVKTKVAPVIKKTIHAANRVNIGAALLRTGILAALKLNLFNVAGRLRYAYLTPQQIQSKDFDPGQISRVAGVKNRLENIFYSSGGKADNFKSAILTGKGNADQDVALSGLNGYYSDSAASYTNTNSLSGVLGIVTYTSEMEGVEGMDGLGEPATSAAIAAATGVLTAIAGLLNSIGNLKRSKGQGQSQNPGSESLPETTEQSTPVTENTNTPEALPSVNIPTVSQESSIPEPQFPSEPLPIKDSPDNIRTISASDRGENKSQSADTPANSGTTDSTESTSQESGQEIKTDGNTKAVATTTNAKPSLMERTKKWVNENKVAAGAIAVGTIGLTIWAIYALTKSEKEKPATGTALSGLTYSRNSKKTKTKKRKSPSPYTFKKLRG